MTVILDATLKVSLVLIAGLTIAAALRTRSAALRHWVLTVTILAAISVPVLELIVPAWNLKTPVPAAIPRAGDSSAVPLGAGPEMPEFSEAIAVAGRAQPAPRTSQLLLTWVWLAGAAASLLVLLAGLTRLGWIASRAERVRHATWLRIADEIGRDYAISRPITLLVSSHPSLLVTWGLLQPKVLIPRAALNWDVDRIRVVLSHELAHIRRGDWIAQIAGEVLRAAYWFNPVLWIACARLRFESEQACDDEVLSGGIDGPDYATHLLELARALKADAAPRLPAPAVARSSSLERRIRAMLDARLTRKPTTRAVRLLTGAMLFAFAAAVAAAQTGPVKLSGIVYDQSGAPVPDAAVVLTHPQSQAKHEVKSNATGYFEFVPLPADDYVLAAGMPGFKKAEMPVTLAGRAVQRDVTLALGSLTETITVVGGPSGGVAGGIQGGVPGGVRQTPSTQVRDLERSAFKRDLEQCAPSSTGGRVRPPRKIKDVKPVYSDSLLAAGVAGTVVLSATIGTDGMVKSVDVVRSVHPELDAAAVDAVKQWQFDGTLLNCVPSEVSMNVSINFAAK